MVNFGEFYGSSNYGDLINREGSDMFCWGLYSINFDLSPAEYDEDDNLKTMFVSFMEIIKTCECNIDNTRGTGHPKYKIPTQVMGVPTVESYSLWVYEKETGNFPPCPSFDCKCDWGDEYEQWPTPPLERIRNPIHKDNIAPHEDPVVVFQESMENYVKNKLREAQQAFSHCCATSVK